MRSSDHDLQERANAAITRMAAYLDEDYLSRHIDASIDGAAVRFHYHAAGLISHGRFHQVLSRFVAYVYYHGLPCPVRLSRSQARDEAVALLEQLYRGSCAAGYFAAVLDARRDQPDGLEFVLATLAEAIKGRRRQLHLQWVFANFLDPSDWNLRCEIATLLLDRFRSWLPEHMAGSAGAQFADEIPTLLTHCLSIDAQLQRISPAI